MDTDIPALHPPALIVTVVRHIVPVIPDVAIRAVTVPARCPSRDTDQEAQIQDQDNHVFGCKLL